MRPLITGAGGLLGSALTSEARSRGLEVFPFRRSELDITDADAVHAVVRDCRPTVVFNCAAYSNVDRAEAEPREAMTVNRDGARNVAEAAARAGALLVHISTDYVFDGKKREPYLPEDQPAPLNLYGISKLAGEMAVREAGGEHLILRTSWLFGNAEQGFVQFVRRSLPASSGRAAGPLTIVSDETSRPTWVAHLAPALLELVEKGARGCLHLANAGHCTRLQLAETVRDVMAAGVGASAGAKTEGATGPAGTTAASGASSSFRGIVGVTSKEFAAPARRPEYSVLELSAAEAVLGRGLPDWREGLEGFLRDGAQ